MQDEPLAAGGADAGPRGATGVSRGGHGREDRWVLAKVVQPVAGGRGQRFDVAVVVQDDQPGALGRRFDGGLLGDDRAAQPTGEGAGQPLDGTHGLRVEVGSAAVADQDQRPPALSVAVDERDP